MNPLTLFVRASFTFLFFLLFWLPSLVFAGRHYLELPAYQISLAQVRSGARPPYPTEVTLKVGPPDQPFEVLLDRLTLCRNQYFQQLLCSHFAEATASSVTLSPETVTSAQVNLIVDLAFLDRIEISSEPEKRAADLEALIHLLSQNYFGGMSRSNESPSDFHPSLLEPMLEWLRRESFQKSLVDLEFLTIFLASSLNPPFLATLSAEERELITAEKPRIFAKIGELSAQLDLTPAQAEELQLKICAATSSVPLQKVLNARLHPLPRHNLFQYLNIE